MEFQIKCTCGEVFTYTVDDDKLKEAWDDSGVLPLIIPHHDHFVTAYMDRRGKVRSVEKVLLAESGRSTQVAESETNEEFVKQTVDSIRRSHSITKDFYRFISSLLVKLESPEALFLAGQYVGYNLWKYKRKKILSLGAEYQLDINLLIKSEIKPIVDLAGNVHLLDDQTIKIQDFIAPQFAIGLVQGIINAISEHSSTQEISIGYNIEGNDILLSLSKK